MCVYIHFNACSDLYIYIYVYACIYTYTYINQRYLNIIKWWKISQEENGNYSSEEGYFLHFKRRLDVLKWKWSQSVVSNSLRTHRLYPTRLLCPWDFPGKNTGVSCHFLLQSIFPTQGSNPGLPHCRLFTVWATREDTLTFEAYQ